jgi:hypothetical protein
MNKKDSLIFAEVYQRAHNGKHEHVKCKYAKDENCKCNGCKDCIANAKEYHNLMNDNGYNEEV